MNGHTHIKNSASMTGSKDGRGGRTSAIDVGNPAASKWLLIGALTLVLLMATLQLLASTGVANAADDSRELLIYSGRSEALVEPLIEKFQAETGIKTTVRYGNSAELVALLFEEGRRSRADLFWSVDAGSLGALTAEGLLTDLESEILGKVDARLQSPDGKWIATSGRARVIAYNTGQFTENELPDGIWEFTQPEWEGRIGWAPTNASFQDFVTAFRVLEGDEKALEWLRAIRANKPRVYPNNTSIVDAIGRGEIDVGFVNHYYLHRFRVERGTNYPVWYYHPEGDAGSIINTAGVGVLNTSQRKDAALKFIEFLLTPETQAYFVQEVNEYPVLASDDQPVNPDLKPLDEINTPAIDLTDLKDLAGTLDLLERSGIL